MFKYILIPSQGQTISCNRPLHTAALALNAGSAMAHRLKIDCPFIDVVVLDQTPRTLEDLGKPLAVRDVRITKRFNGHYDYCEYFESCGDVIIPCTCRREVSRG